MQKKGQKLKRPIQFQKKLALRAFFVLCSFSVISAAYAFYPKISSNVSEFIAKNIDAKLEDIFVTGTKNLTHETLLASLGLEKGDSLVGFKAAEVRESLQALPWVKEAVVERQLPSTLKIAVYEYTPIAKLEKEDALWLIDSDGHLIISIEKNEFKHLPSLRGKNAEGQAASLFGLLMEKEIALGEEVVEARYVGERRWDIAFSSGTWVQLPENNPERALDVLKRFDAKKKVLAMKNSMVDLRLEDRIVLRLPPKKKIKERIL